MKLRVGVLGSGIVGRVMAKGLETHGYDVRIGSRLPGKLEEFSRSTNIPAGTFADVAAWGEGLVLAVLGRAAAEALREAGAANLDGKWIMDTTNPIAGTGTDDGVIRFFTGPNTSLMEQLQAAFPPVRFVKAFNSVGNGLMVNPTFAGGRATMFYCGNDPDAKAAVARIIDQFGWEGADVGTAKAARAIEPLCQLWCLPGFLQGSWNHAFRLVRP